jgi:hypothetical protein
MESIKSKRTGWDVELDRLAKQNKRLDNINEALSFAIKCLAFSAAVGFIVKFLA